MVESGQLLGIREYRNPVHPGLGIEVLDHRELRRRIPDDYYCAIHRLNFHQILLVRDGTATGTVDFTKYQCGPGTLVHTRPGQTHQLPLADDGGPADLDATLLLFTASFPPAMPPDPTQADPYSARCWELSGDDMVMLEASVQDLAAEYRKFDDGISADVLRHLLAVLLLRMNRMTAPTGERANPQRAALFRSFRHELERSFVDVRNVQEYARRLGCSRKTLNRACLEAVGLTAKDLADARTALEAQRLLANSDLSVAAIAAHLGFTEPTNFGKFFTREVGRSPSAFRNRGTNPDTAGE